MASESKPTVQKPVLKVSQARQHWLIPKSLSTQGTALIMALATQDQKISTPTLPLVVETGRSESRYIPETVYLTATDPDSPNQEYTRLMVAIEDHNHGEDILVDLRTNNDRFAFVCKAIRSHFNKHHHIVETWLPEFDTEF